MFAASVAVNVIVCCPGLSSVVDVQLQVPFASAVVWQIVDAWMLLGVSASTIVIMLPASANPLKVGFCVVTAPFAGLLIVGTPGAAVSTVKDTDELVLPTGFVCSAVIV